jgi:hypothetical protein
MADIFISYSRADTEFVHILHDALVASKYDTWVDWADIAPTTDWWQEIEAGIESAHTFIFVISKDSVESKYCRREIDHAITHNKRLIPVLRRKDYNRNGMHPKLGQHQWLTFLEESSFDQAFAKLVEAINTDIDYQKNHTRLEVRAIEWESNSYDPSLLLRGSDLEKAQQWLLDAVGKEPLPTALQKNFVAVSRQSSLSRHRRLVLVLGSLLGLALAGGGTALWQFNKANQSLAIAEEQRAIAEEQKQQADLQRQAAEKAKESEALQREQAEVAKDKAEDALKEAEKQRQLAEEKKLEAEVAQAAEVTQRKLAEKALVRAEKGEAEANRQSNLAMENAEAARDAAAEADRQRLVADKQRRTAETQQLLAELSEAKALINSGYVFDSLLVAMRSGANMSRLKSQYSDLSLQIATTLYETINFDGFLEANRLIGHSQWVEDAHFIQNDEYLISASADKTIKIWDKIGHEIESINAHLAEINNISVGLDDELMASSSKDGMIKIWDVDSLNNIVELKSINHAAEINDLAFSHTSANHSLESTVQLKSQIEKSENNDLLAYGDSQGNIVLWKADALLQPSSPIGPHEGFLSNN